MKWKNIKDTFISKNISDKIYQRLCFPSLTWITPTPTVAALPDEIPVCGSKIVGLKLEHRHAKTKQNLAETWIRKINKQ